MIERLRSFHARGFSLIEAAIILALVGTVIGGIWYASAQYNQQIRVRDTFNGLMTIGKEIANLFHGHRAPADTHFGEEFLYNIEGKTIGAMVKNIPNGFAVADENLSSPIFREIKAIVRCYSDVGCGVMISGYNPSSENDCKKFGSLATSTFNLGGLNGFGLSTESYEYYIESQRYYADYYYSTVSLPNGLIIEDLIKPDPFWAGSLDGCYVASLWIPF